MAELTVTWRIYFGLLVIHYAIVLYELQQNSCVYEEYGFFSSIFKVLLLI